MLFIKIMQYIRVKLISHEPIYVHHAFLPNQTPIYVHFQQISTVSN